MKNYIKTSDEKIKIYVPKSNKKSIANISENEEVKIYKLKKELLS